MDYCYVFMARLRCMGCVAWNFRGDAMQIDPTQGHPAMDYNEHQRTYAGFVKVFVWGTVACVALLAVMALTLV